MKKKSKKGKILVSKNKLGRVILILCISIVVLLIFNIIQLFQGSKLKKRAQTLAEQSASVQADKAALEESLKEKEAEIESLNEDLSITEELQENVNLVKNLRSNNEKLQERLTELGDTTFSSETTTAQDADSSSSSSSASSDTTTASYAATTASTAAASTTADTSSSASSGTGEDELSSETLIGDELTKYYHKSDCKYAEVIEADNKVTGTKEQLEAQSYKACTYCNP